MLGNKMSRRKQKPIQPSDKIGILVDHRSNQQRHFQLQENVTEQFKYNLSNVFLYKLKSGKRRNINEL